ncbi:MAG: DUF4159 domain-containing protein [Candidatus Latescibacterota bacterium]|nr:DUF4159 domain-containing protein [Candidatus Latescibacterota bacterium]MEC8992006.1 DUF4159 domain-containing protein [Candidatus Latescibacterota bacterium]MEE3042475.1 DUF4159 domain-containing protein [Candidatus Latescibacterota bacterium]MEE3335017.1 DUF4159 domain-containing protein [Candidatus Latescibacterota bacterium]
MNTVSQRFSVPSDGINRHRLLAETRRLVIAGLLISMGLVGGASIYFVVVPKEEEAPPPAIARIIIRKPRATKPFQLKRQRLRPRSMTKKVSALRPRLAMPTTRRLTGASMFGRVETIDYAVDTDVQIDLETGPIAFSTARVTGTKEPETRIAMREELLDLDALDTGKYKGLIIQDPTDRRKVRGFVYLGTAWATDLEPVFASAAKAIPNLVDAVNIQTGITAKVDAHLFIDSQELFRTPFVYITAEEAFELTGREKENLGEYMRRGGFVFADNANATVEFSQAEASLRQIFRAALGAQGQFRPIPNSHPLYHTFYDFDGPPVGSELGTPTDAEQWGVNYRILPQHSYRLEGVFLGDRLVALYSDRGYVHKWAENYGNEPQLRFGINVVVFALTQEGSIAQQQIDYYSEGGAE